MTQYIDKAALIAEIESYKNSFCDINGYLENIEENGLAYNTLCDLEDSINTLEVKEVDIENTAITEWNDYIKKIDGEPDYAYMLIKKEDYIVLAKHFFELRIKAQKGQKVIKQDNKDLCKTCKHYWQDFPLPLESVVSHCEILDDKKGLSANMNDEISYPCLKCPFNSYIKNEKL